MAVMQEFVYRAVDPRGGAVVKGSVEAASETAVTGKLKAQGLTPLEVTLKSKTGIHRELKMPGVSKQVSAKSLAIFAANLHGATPADAVRPVVLFTSSLINRAIAAPSPNKDWLAVTSRNASSMEMPSTIGVYFSKTANTCALTSEYRSPRGGTTMAFGQRRSASAIGIADRQPNCRAS